MPPNRPNNPGTGPGVSARACIQSRREFLWRFGGGLGGIALTQLLAEQGLLAAAPAVAGSPVHGVLDQPHHRPRARRVIQLFMNGGASQMDLFDYKPELAKRHGQKFDPGGGARVEAATSEPGKVLKPMFEFRQHGQCGRWVSSLLPHTAACVDDLAFLMSMTSRTNVHGPGSYLMNTGFLLPGFPCLGAWVSYALGCETDNLPAFVVLPDVKGLPYNQKGNFSAGFLPVTHQGTIIAAGGAAPIADLHAPPSAHYITERAEREGLSLLEKLNRTHLVANDGDSRLEARIRAYELAAKMQLSAPEAFDLAGESEATRRLYGLDDKVTEEFGRRCLTARRLVERGVRLVQVWSGAGGPTNNWDNHASIPKELPPMCASTDRPVAALLKDLKGRGLLEDTLVLWSTEFGRMPFSQGSDGRDHNGGTFVGWMAGGGVKGGVAYGQSDEWSWRAAEQAATRDFGTQCLLARRLAEAGVRFIEISNNGWDHHNNLRQRIQQNAREIDQPVAALIADLKQRGLLKDTLLLWGGEFGRTTTGQNGDGRNHNNRGFTMWMAGGGVKGGFRYGATDAQTGSAVSGKVHLHDMHATVLHILGMDHTKLTYRYGGRDFRLTDVHGNVVKDILA